MQLVNQYRENNGVRGLLLSDTLSVASEGHSQDMDQYEFFAHNNAASSYYAAGSQPWDRMRAEGYDNNTLMGENIAVGCESAERCFELWRNSPAHNAGMLDGRYQVVGVARANAPGSVHGWYWTTDFGATADLTSHEAGGSSQMGEADEPIDDGPGIENGEMSGTAVWKQEATEGAKLILDGYARLGDYDNGWDELQQEIRVRENIKLAYWPKIETTERRHLPTIWWCG